MARQKVDQTTLPVILLGCGGVGQFLLEHVVRTRQLHSRLGLSISFIGVSDSSSLIVAKDNKKGFNDEELRRIRQHKAQGSPLRSFDSEASIFVDLPDYEKILTFLGNGILVDCTASSTEALLSAAVQAGASVVLANKKPITASIESYDIIVSRHGRFKCESTVGAGLPVMATLDRLNSSGDPVSKISGALSGTLGYVMSKLQEGKLFSDIVREAKSLGYTEPDPRDDLSGLDVARKALIMARSIGWRLELMDIEIESLYPDHMAPSAMPLADFLESGLLSLDAALNERCSSALKNGNVLRYVATLQGQNCKVGLAEVSKESPLGQLVGSDNLVEISSRCYGSSPLVIIGAGAGNDTTAAGVLADIVSLRAFY